MAGETEIRGMDEIGMYVQTRLMEERSHPSLSSSIKVSIAHDSVKRENRFHIHLSFTRIATTHPRPSHEGHITP